MPTDRSNLDEQLRAQGGSTRWWEQRELRDLPGVLNADEQILAIARGRVARVRWLRRSWLIVVTDRRLLCLRSTGRAWRQLEVRAEEISRVALRIGPFRGRVVVVGGGRTYRLLVPRPDAYRVRNALSNLGTAAERPARLAPTRMVHRMIDHVLALPAVALGPDPAQPAVPAALAKGASDERVETLEREVHELRQQMRFLEQLLRERQPDPVAGRELPFE